MFKGFAFGQYLPGDSPIHRLSPKTKLWGLIIYMILLFVATDAVSYGLLAASLAVSIFLAGVNPYSVLKGLKPILVLALITFMFQAFSLQGQVLFEVMGLSVTLEGIAKGVILSIRLLLLVAASTMVTLTTSLGELTEGIEGLLRPLRVIGVPASEIAMMMTIAIRFIPTLFEETDRIIKAQIARGAELDSGGIMKRVKNMAPVLVPLFMSAFRRADELAIAMESRCYRPGARRTRMKQAKSGTADFVAMLVLAGISAAVVAIRVWY